MTLLIVASLAAAPALGIPALRRRLVRAIARARKRFAERARLRLAAALLDLGNHLMLCDEERRARRLGGLLEKARRRGRDPEHALPASAAREPTTSPSKPGSGPVRTRGTRRGSWRSPAPFPVRPPTRSAPASRNP